MIVRNLEGIEDFGDYLAVRATLTDDDADLVESLECLQGLGFKSILFADLCPNSGLQRSADADGSSRRHREDGYLGLMEHILASASGIEEIPEMVLRDSVQDLQYGARRYFCCDTGRHHLYLDPDGDLYPCFRLMTPDGVQRVGSLESPPSPESLQVFYDTNVLTTVCFSCWARYLCGGPCFGNSFAAYGDFSTPDPVHCYHQKFSLYCAAYLLDHFNNAEKMSRADPGT
jgi:uncharacterized protein